MSLASKLENIKKKLSGRISFNENLSKFSWFNLGGPATVFFKPNSLNELSLFLREIKGTEKIKILGAGSNTLIRDGGFDGVVIKLGNSFSHLSKLDEETIIAGASALDRKVSDFALENFLTGFEFLSCIPGTIGGAVRMNSGCYDNDISKILISVQAIDLNGNVRIIKSSDVKFFYRGSNLNTDLIFLSATFKGKKTDKSIIEKKIKNFVIKKKNDQPSKIKTCGSTFKNPINNSAWKLIKECGCAGMKVGDAQISKKHCNFFVNNGKAKSNELEELILKVKDQVLNKTGIELELEIKIAGEKL